MILAGAPAADSLFSLNKFKYQLSDDLGSFFSVFDKKKCILSEKY